MKSAAKDWNVIFIISDQHRRDASGCYGHKIVKTPGIDRVAETGALFLNAYTPAPLCGPARSAVMTGTHVHTSGGFTHPQDEQLNDLPTLGSVFRDAGYATAAIGKVHIHGESAERDLGFDERALRYYTYGMRDYIKAIGQKNVDKYNGDRPTYNPDNAPVELKDELMFDNLVTDRVIEFIEKNKDKKFFTWMGLEKPHPQLYAPARFHDMYDPKDMELPETAHDPVGDIPETTQRRKWGRGADHMTDEQTKGTAAAYYATWRYVVASHCRPCQLVHQAHVYCAYAFFVALFSIVVFAVAWARIIDNRIAFGAYGSVAPLSLMLFIASYTPFPALIHRLPSAPHYLVE